MAEHDIEITIPTKPLINVDATILIRSDGAKLGELRILEGSSLDGAYLTREER